MAKPTRYTMQDMRRKRLHEPFNPRISAFIRRQRILMEMHQEKSILAARALRRCVELESLLEVISEATRNGLGQPLPDAPDGRNHYPYSYRQLRSQVEGLERNLQVERMVSASLREELALHIHRGTPDEASP